jgi:hypothetical protein
MRITIASIDMKPSRCLVHTTEGKKYGVWNDKVGKWGLEAGGTYDVETETTEVSGRNLTNITSAKRVAGAPAAVSRAPAPSAAASCPSKDEQIFVVALLKSLIEAGEVKNDKTALWTTTQMLRGLYKHSFGFDAMNRQMEAAE